MTEPHPPREAEAPLHPAAVKMIDILREHGLPDSVSDEQYMAQLYWMKRVRMETLDFVRHLNSVFGITLDDTEFLRQ